MATSVAPLGTTNITIDNKTTASESTVQVPSSGSPTSPTSAAAPSAASPSSSSSPPAATSSASPDPSSQSAATPPSPGVTSKTASEIKDIGGSDAAKSDGAVADGPLTGSSKGPDDVIKGVSTTDNITTEANPTSAGTSTTTKSPPPTSSSTNTASNASKPTTSPATPTPDASAASTSVPAGAGAKRKKKRRKGLSGFFAALCGGGAGDFEDESVDDGRTKEMRQVGKSAGTAAAATKGVDASRTGVAGRQVEPNGTQAVKADSATAAGDGRTKPATTTSADKKLPAPSAGTPHVDATKRGPARDGMGAGIGLGAVVAVAGGAGAVTSAAGVGAEADEAGKKDVNEPAQVVVVPPSAGTTERVPQEVPPIEETEGLTSAAVQPPGSGGRLLASHNNAGQTSSSRTYSTEISTDLLTDTDEAGDSVSASNHDEPMNQQGSRGVSNGDAVAAGGAVSGHRYEDAQVDEMDVDMEMDEEDRLIAQGGIGIPLDANGNPAPLLPPMAPEHQGRKCLVLDLDETLLHSSFKMISSADYIVPVEIESQTHNVYVIKRPGVDNFLRQMGELYEVVVFTASLSKYADPVLDMLDVDRVVKHRLFRESCYNHKGNYVKDLSQLGRDMHSCIIIDNSPASYIFHPNNAVPVSTWFNDPHDTELTDLCPFLADLETVDDIRGVLDGSL